MSVADIKASRRKFRQRQQNGQAPRPQGRSVAQSIERNRMLAMREASSKKAK